MNKTLTIILTLIAGLVVAGPVKTFSPEKPAVLADATAAKEIAAYYAANPAAHLAATNWGGVLAAANNDSKKIKALCDLVGGLAAEKAAKDKADKAKKKAKEGKAK
jgi:hypothetical protein